MISLISKRLHNTTGNKQGELKLAQKLILKLMEWNLMTTDGTLSKPNQTRANEEAWYVVRDESKGKAYGVT